MDTLAQRENHGGKFPTKGKGSLDAVRCELRCLFTVGCDVHKQMVSLLVPVSSSPYVNCGDFSPGPGGWVMDSVD